jgi:hypothetical protein
MKLLAQAGILAAAAEIPTRSGFCFFRESERDEEWRLALYARFAELRKTASTRRFWFLHGNIHLLYCPQGPLLPGRCF